MGCLILMGWDTKTLRHLKSRANLKFSGLDRKWILTIVGNLWISTGALWLVAGLHTPFIVDTQSLFKFSLAQILRFDFPRDCRCQEEAWLFDPSSFQFQNGLLICDGQVTVSGSSHPTRLFWSGSLSLYQQQLQVNHYTRYLALFSLCI